jgi:hypothetical protein
MSLLSQFFNSASSRGGQTGGIGQYGVGLATGFTYQLPIDLMLIGGGGGGGGAGQQAFSGVSTNIPLAYADTVLAGGGGAGRGLIYTNLIVDVGVSYPITVGAGGAENSRGGASKFGFITAGGGGAGGGTTPLGVTVTPDFGGLYGGSAGGPAIIDASPSAGGGIGVVPYSDSLYATVNVSLYPATASFDSSSNVGSNFFKQAINSTVYPSHYSQYAFPLRPNPGAPAQHGAGGGCDNIGSDPVGIPLASPSYYGGVTEVGLSQRWGLSPLISPATRALFTSALSRNTNTIGGNGTPYTPVSSPSANSYSLFVNPINPGGYLPQIIGYPYTNSVNLFGPGGPTGILPVGIGSVGRWFWSPDIAISSIPIANAPGGGPFFNIPATGGSFTTPVVTTPNAGSPFVTLASGIGKTVTYQSVSAPQFNGSPGNGGGGCGGLRHAPIFMQGTASVPFQGPGGTTTRTTPYTFTVPGSSTPMASGAAGGSGSVWVIYPSDYAAATVTGNTPVPSPPAIRIYRWDGAGTITFNAS